MEAGLVGIHTRTRKAGITSIAETAPRHSLISSPSAAVSRRLEIAPRVKADEWARPEHPDKGRLKAGNVK